MRRLAPLALSLLVIGSAFITLPAITRASSGATVYIQTVTASGRNVEEPLPGACYQIINASIVGCDENADGKVWFKDIAPGTYTVTQTTSPDGYLPADDFQITVKAGVAEQTFPAQVKPDLGSGYVNVAIVSKDEATGQRLTGACYQIVGWSNVGCDVNDDGQVDFKGVKTGIYPIDFIRDPAGYSLISPQPSTIEVSATDGNPAVHVVTYQANAGTPADYVDVSIVSEQEFTDERLMGACYQIVNWSNVGCDVNNDGQVDFSDIPVGTYQIRIVQKPGGYTPIAQPTELVVTDQGGNRLFHTLYYLSPEQECPTC